jgi:MFS family permease
MSNLRQRVDRVVRPEGHVFFGWYIVAAAAGVQMLAGMLWMQSYGAYMVLLQEGFGWSKTLVAGAFALTRVESGILGPLQGWLADRFGPRLVLQIGTLVFGAGFILFSRVDSLLSFYLTFILVALGASLGGFATLMVSLVHWFNRHRAKAVAASQIGYSLGGLSVPIVILALEAYGWRVTALASGVLVLVLGLPLVSVVRHRPETSADVVDGIRGDETEGDVARGGAHRGQPDFSAREAMRTSSFWLISVGHALALLTVSSMMVHLIPHLTESFDYSLALAGGVVALMTGFQMLGQIFGGYLGDRIDKRLICTACMAAHAIGLLLVTFATSWVMVVGFAVLHGLAWGTRGPLMVAIRADYFGAASFGTIMGFSSLIVMFGMSGGPIIAGVMADMTGNYTAAFTVIACVSALGSLCFLAAKPPVR